MAKNRKTPDMNLPVWFDGQNINEAMKIRSHSKLNAEKSLTLFSALFFYLFQGLKWEKRGDEW